MAEVDLEPRLFALMRVIADSEGQSQITVGEWLGIAPSSMVAVIDNLESRGLVDRRPHPTDRRSRTLFLTDHGKKVLEGASELATSLEQTVCSGFSEKERQGLLNSLTRVADNLGMVRALSSHASPGRCSPESPASTD
jgi:DNA-binding MarR family transcriptional regulator